MKILVVLANYGTKNDAYLRRLLEEYRSMSYQVHIVVLTDQPKHLGDDVEVCVERPVGDPWTFPFAHKRILAERISSYDLFIYSEDDTLITQRNIDVFVEATVVLGEDEIAGFLRSEMGKDGRRYYSSVHSHYHWEPGSIVRRGACLFARFSNEHSASYILTQKQLRRAIASGGFLVKPHQEKYDLLVSAATDPYTQCGLNRLINISQLQEFTLPHLPNRYVGQLGVNEGDLNLQIEALKEIGDGSHPCTVLFDNVTRLPRERWSKSYYEDSTGTVEGLIPKDVRKVLSFGCGYGRLEAQLVRRGIDVTAIPIDSVIGRCAEARGIKVIYGDTDYSLAQLSEEQFDCILILGVLHLLPAPRRVLTHLSRLLSTNGVMVASVANMSQLPVLWWRIVRQGGFRDLGNFERTGTQFSCLNSVKQWFNDSKLALKGVVPIIPRRAEWVDRVSAGTIGNLLASEFFVTGTAQ